VNRGVVIIYRSQLWRKREKGGGKGEKGDRSRRKKKKEGVMYGDGGRRHKKGRDCRKDIGHRKRGKKKEAAHEKVRAGVWKFFFRSS